MILFRAVTNEELINYFVNNNSKIISRFKYVLAVIDYLFDQVAYEKKTLNRDEEEIFEVGYHYIYDRFMTISTILETVFNNDKDEMEIFQKEINLLLYIIDFEDEIDSLEKEHQAEHKKFAELEDKVMQSIENKEHVEDGMFVLVDEISLTTFEGLGVDYYGITDIFYDIACDLELINDEDEDYFDINDLITYEKK